MRNTASPDAPTRHEEQSDSLSPDGVRVARIVRGAGVLAPHAPPGLTVTLALGSSARMGWAGGGLSADLVLHHGDLVVVPAGLVHEVEIRDPVDLLTVSVGAGFAAELASDLSLDPGDLAPQLGVRDRHAEAALHALLDERGRPGTRRIAEAAATTALVRLLRPQTFGDGAPLSAARVRRVADYVHGRIGEEIAVADLAAHVDLSPAHFSRLFAGATGLSPGRYVQAARLDAAARLLSASRASVGDVAHRVGYTDPSAFGAAFRQRFGASPTDYRKSHGR